MLAPVEACSCISGTIITPAFSSGIGLYNFEPSGIIMFCIIVILQI